MKKILILIPVFNDWESLYKLINEINEIIKRYNFTLKDLKDYMPIQTDEFMSSGVEFHYLRRF